MPKERVRVTSKDQITLNISPYPPDTTLCQVSGGTSDLVRMNGSIDTKPSEMFCDVETRTNLIVNYLPQAMSQEDLRVLFCSVGELESCKLIRDKNNGQSLGYAFVNYKSSEGAVKAISSYNGLRLHNKAIKVSFARPSSDQIKGANLYISGLSRHFSTQALYEMFKPYGQIITCRVLCDPINGKSKGVGFIRYNLKSEAEEAIKHLNSQSQDGSSEPIQVKFANQPTFNTSKALAAAAAAQLGAKLALSPVTLAPQTFGGFIIQPGLMTSPVVNLVQPSQQTLPIPVPVGYCSVNERSQPLSVAPSPHAPAPQVTAPQYTLLVHNLPPHIDNSALLALISRCAPVQGTSVTRGAPGLKSKSVGVVTLNSYEDCLRVITSLDGLCLDQDHVIRITSVNQSQSVPAVPQVLIGQAVTTAGPVKLSGLPAAGLTAVNGTTELGPAMTAGVSYVPIANDQFIYNNGSAVIPMNSADMQLFNSGLTNIPDNTSVGLQSVGSFVKIGQQYLPTLAQPQPLNAFY